MFMVFLARLAAITYLVILFFSVISYFSSVDVKKLTVTAVFDCYKKLHTLLK